jgi:hypothetical protein
MATLRGKYNTIVFEFRLKGKLVGKSTYHHVKDKENDITFYQCDENVIDDLSEGEMNLIIFDCKNDNRFELLWRKGIKLTFNI